MTDSFLISKTLMSPSLPNKVHPFKVSSSVLDCSWTVGRLTCTTGSRQPPKALPTVYSNSPHLLRQNYFCSICLRHWSRNKWGKSGRMFTKLTSVSHTDKTKLKDLEKISLSHIVASVRKIEHKVRELLGQISFLKLCSIQKCNDFVKRNIMCFCTAYFYFCLVTLWMYIISILYRNGHAC